MRSKSLIFLALVLLGVVGCNKEASSVKEASVTNASTPTESVAPTPDTTKPTETAAPAPTTTK